MAKPTLQEMMQLPDPAQSDHFEFIIADIPGGGSGSSGSLRIQCQQVVLPGKSIEPVSQETSGNQLQHVGRSLYSHDVSITFIETRMYTAHKAIRNWIEYCRRHETQLGHYKAEYAKTATLKAFDQKGTTIEEFTLYGVWPNQLPDVQYDGTSSSIIMIAAGFQCDWWEPTDKFASAAA